MKEKAKDATSATGSVKHVSDQIPTVVYHVIIPS